MSNRKIDKVWQMYRNSVAIKEYRNKSLSELSDSIGWVATLNYINEIIEKETQ